MYQSDEIWDSLPSWLKVDGIYSDIVLSSRIRLARNLENFPFPNNASDDKLDKIVSEIQNIFIGNEILSNMKFWLLSDLSKLERQMLCEKKIITPEFSNKSDHGAVTFDSQSLISIMVNEEDHFRLQIIDSGIELEYLWEKINKFGQMFDNLLNFSFSEELGFITSCPNNTGTGLRISVLMHLPILEFKNDLQPVFDESNYFKLSVRDFYGIERNITGSIYQISNKLTLGWTELKLVDEFLKIALQIVDKEQAARHKLLEDRNIEIEDKVFRSLGIIERAKMLSSREFIEHYSNLKLGIELGFITEIEKQDLQELLLWVQPAHLQRHYVKELNSLERDIARIEIIRAKLRL